MIIATLISGFFVVIVSIIVVTMLLKRHFSRRILTTEKNIDFFVVECILSGDTSTSREGANNVRRGRYDILHLNIWLFVTNLKIKRRVKILILKICDIENTYGCHNMSYTKCHTSLVSPLQKLKQKFIRQIKSIYYIKFLKIHR